MPPELVAAETGRMAEKEQITIRARLKKQIDRENIKFTSATRCRADALTTLLFGNPIGAPRSRSG